MSRNVALIFCFLLLVASAASAASLRAEVGDQAHQNQQADRDHLSRMEDDEMAARWARLELLEPVAAKTSSYYLHQIRQPNRYLRPWSKLFLARLSRQYYARFKTPLRVTSLLRPAHYQSSLQRRNGNAAASDGPKASTHLTGASLDISKKGMTSEQIVWMRNVLASLNEKEHIFAIEEFKQPNFHVMVYRSYEDYVAAKVGSKR